MLAVVLMGAGAVGCQGCSAQPPSGPAAAPSASSEAGKPTIRLYVLSTVAGALEPCGCTKDQLGGVDHLAAYVEAQAKNAPNSVVVGAGPLLFMEPKLRPDDATQATWKAEALALAAKDIGLVGWAPGVNDWAAGADSLASLTTQANASLLAHNLEGKAPIVTAVVREVGGVKVGIVGVADPKDKSGARPEGVNAKPALDAMRAGLAEVKQKGAKVLIGAAAIPRGEALRLADNLPELHVLVVGKPFEAGEANDKPKAPVLSGSTLIVEAANHLQTVGVVDLFVRGDQTPLVFADAGGVAKADELLSMAQRIRDLEARINSWALDKTVKPEDIAARKADLDKLRADKAKMEAEQPAVKGSFFRYTMVEVRNELGRSEPVYKRMLEYYKRVNEHNKKAFADRKPPSPEPGKATFVGVEACTACHDEPRKVWDKTPHASAYPTLQKDYKEFNLDCVSCHVTGYGKAGGSTVTHNQKLQNVQCEECHGPGSLHAKTPEKKDLIVRKPSTDLCVGCHHPPHVESFDPKEKMKLILGKGHGM